MRNGLRQSYVGRFAPLHHSLGFRRISNDSPLLRLSSQVLRIQEATLHQLVHPFLGNGPTIPLRVCLGIRFARGVILPPQELQLQGKSEQQQTYWSLQGCSVLNLMYKYNTIYQSSPMIKRKLYGSK